MVKKPRQTISYLQRRLQEVGLNPDPRHGQNFLVDLNLLELLARSANLGPQDVVLEVGTGTGSLTSMMAEQAAAVVTVEIDAHLHQLAREELESHANVTMLQQDALHNKNRFHPRVMETVRNLVQQAPDRQFKLAANLPYNVATPVISNLLMGDLVPVTMTVTIQKELADRIAAKPRTKDYSALSIWVQSLCDVELVRVMPPSVFWPRPKVHSAILHLVHRPDKRQQIADLAFFHRFVRAMFFHRRKFLRSVIRSAFKGQLDKTAVDQVLHAMNFGPDTRAEQLDVDTMQALCERMREKVNEN